LVVDAFGSEADALESLRLVWPAYFPSWDASPRMPPVRLSVAGYAETWASVLEQLARLEAAVPGADLPRTMRAQAVMDRHGCLRHGIIHHEATGWPRHQNQLRRADEILRTASALSASADLARRLR
jgi:hypothetical protein